MPHWPASFVRARDHLGHSVNVRPGRASASVAAIAAGYTLAHAGRQLRLGPIAFWIVVGTLVIMAIWTVATATYFAFRDDVLTRLIARQAEMQFGYEDRIAELRAQVDRMSSRQLLDQEQFEQKLDQLVRRQTTLESRASALNSFPDPTVTGSVKAPVRSEPARPGILKPSPMSDTAAPPPSTRDRRAGMSVDMMLARLQTSLDRVEARQSLALSSIEQSYDSKARRMRGIDNELGVDAGKYESAKYELGKYMLAGESVATGGPFIAARINTDANAFERQVHRVSVARGQ